MGSVNNSSPRGSPTTSRQTDLRRLFQILRASLVGVAGIFVAALALFCLALPVSAAITLLPTPFDRFSYSIWAIPLILLIILGAAFLAARSLWAFLVICAAGIGLVYVSMSYGRYIGDGRWQDTDVQHVLDRGDVATIRQMYYDILVRQTPRPPPVLPHSPSDSFYDALKDRLRQQVEAKRQD